MQWATSAKPVEGGVYLDVRHTIDTGFKKREGREPDSRLFEPAAGCQTLIEPVLIEVMSGKPEVSSWGALYEAAEEASGYEGWADGQRHEVAAAGARVAFGGLKLDVSRLGHAEAIRTRLVEPMVWLLRGQPDGRG